MPEVLPSPAESWAEGEAGTAGFGFTKFQGAPELIPTTRNNPYSHQKVTPRASNRVSNWD